MEITGVGEAAQAVQVIIEGLKVLLNVSGSVFSFSTEQISKLAMAIHTTNKKNKETLKPGEVNFMKLSEASNGKIAVMQVNDNFENVFSEYALENGLSYSKLVDLNKSDGCFEVAFSEKDAVAFNVFITQNYPKAKAYSFNDYANNSEEADFLSACMKDAKTYEQIQELVAKGKFENEEKKVAENELIEDKEKDLIKGTKSEDIGTHSAGTFSEAMKLEQYECVNIKKEMINNKNEEQLKLLIPGEKDEFVYVDKKLVTMRMSDDNINVALHKNFDYVIVNKDDEPIEKDGKSKVINGAELINKNINIDKINEEKRKLLEKNKNKVKLRFNGEEIIKDKPQFTVNKPVVSKKR